MKINIYLDRIINDLGSCYPDTLSDIVRFTRNIPVFRQACLLASNSKKSSDYLLDICETFIGVQVYEEELADIYDIELAGLLVLASDVHAMSNHVEYEQMLSRVSAGAVNLHWSRSMATSYMLHNEVCRETIRKSA